MSRISRVEDLGWVPPPILSAGDPVNDYGARVVKITWDHHWSQGKKLPHYEIKWGHKAKTHLYACHVFEQHLREEGRL